LDDPVNLEKKPESDAVDDNARRLWIDVDDVMDDVMDDDIGDNFVAFDNVDDEIDLRSIRGIMLAL
jgi:hypothetical protein